MAGIRDLLKKGKDALSQPEGAATALTAGLIFGGPVGLGLGVLQGILAKRLHQSEADALASEASTSAELDRHIRASLEGALEFADSDLDKQQLATLQSRRGMLAKLAGHPDAKVRAKALEEMVALTKDARTELDDIESRREKLGDEQTSIQRNIISGAAKDLRTRYSTAVENRRSLRTSADQINRLLNDPKFDVNSPLNRGRLAELMRTNARSILSDPAGFSDVLNAGGGALAGGAVAGPWGAAAGGVLGMIAGTMKADEFNFSRDDWRRIATAMYAYESRQWGANMTSIQKETGALENAAARLGLFPEDYSVADYILGESENLPAPVAAEPVEEVGPPSPDAPRQPARTSSAPVNAVNRALTNLENYMNRRKQRPTN